jgi:hypothetical protein
LKVYSPYRMAESVFCSRCNGRAKRDASGASDCKASQGGYVHIVRCPVEIQARDSYESYPARVPTLSDCELDRDYLSDDSTDSDDAMEYGKRKALGLPVYNGLRALVAKNNIC